MRSSLFVLAALGVALVVRPACADDEEHIRAAQENLRSARDHLKTAGGGFGGHRQQALDRIENAMQDLNAALRVAGKKDRQEDKKVQHIDKQIDQLEKRKQKLGAD